MCGFTLKFDKTPMGVRTLLACIEELQRLKWTFDVVEGIDACTVTI